MSEIGIFEAKTKFSELCTQVEEAGAEYVITRRGRPIARITGVAPEQEDASGLLERMAQTDQAHGKISEDEADFPEVWLHRSSGRADPLAEEN
ncbi:MAG: type II toxin-antitoxin system prevent-host-death family antitoxin [Verrucomicrobia bacterium]|jgi:prevent-host-death family protein|nr:type II toxin-antitoxin system prevent-host-death family antitoxin [Verrucomicrobiota bacterium]